MAFSHRHPGRAAARPPGHDAKNRRREVLDMSTDQIVRGFGRAPNQAGFLAWQLPRTPARKFQETEMPDCRPIRAEDDSATPVNQ